MITIEFTKEDYCVTRPNLQLIRLVDIIYTIYNLSGRCSCGKLYSEHLNWVKTNEEIEAEIKQKSGTGI